MAFAHRFEAFGGMIPRLAARHLPPRMAQAAVNCRVTSGNLEALRAPLLRLDSDLPNLDSFYRFHDVWLTWERRVHVARAPVQDTDRRFYYSGDGEPRVSNYEMATAQAPFPTSSFVLGVHPPTEPPEVDVAGGEGNDEARAYCYTFVTQWGEESAPSPASEIKTGKDDGTWTISALQTPHPNQWTVAAAVWSDGVVTITVDDGEEVRGLRVGETISVAGVTPAGYNTARATVTAVTEDSISYALASNPGAWVSGGAIGRDAPHNTANMKIRIYRTVTDDAGNSVFRFVKEVAATVVSTTDDGLPQEALPSGDWLMPPVDLKSLLSLPNGIMCGISGKLVCFSEVNKPYAWPLAYQYAMDFDGIGAAAYGTSVVVPTAANPYVLVANDPAAVSMAKLDLAWPCLSEASIASLGNGAGYATKHGYVAITAGGPLTLTETLYTEIEWERLRPDSISAATHGSRLCLAHNRDTINRQILIIGRGDDAHVVQANVYAERLLTDLDTGDLYFSDGSGGIWQWDANQGERIDYDWLSKEILLGRPVNLGVAKVDADFAMTPDEAADAEAARAAVIETNQDLIDNLATRGSLNAISVGRLSVNGSLIEPLPVIVWDSLLFTLYVDGKAFFTKVIGDGRPFRLPASRKYDNFAVRCSGNVAVKGLVVAETFKDLKVA